MHFFLYEVFLVGRDLYLLHRQLLRCLTALAGDLANGGWQFAGGFLPGLDGG